jgi:hypothetical protein
MALIDGSSFMQARSNLWPRSCRSSAEARPTLSVPWRCGRRHWQSSSTRAETLPRVTLFKAHI